MGSEVRVPREELDAEKLLDILTRMQAEHRLYQYEAEYQPHEDAVDDLKIELLELLCPEGEMPDLQALRAAPAPAAAGAEASEATKRINIYSVSNGFTQREPWPLAPTQGPPVDLRVAAEGVIYRAEECGMFRTHVMTDFQASLHVLRAALSAGAGAPAEGEGGAG